MQVIVELSQGEMCKVHDSVDPDATGGAIIALLQIHDLGLRGPNIHILFKDVCHCEAARFVMLFRAWQLGFLPKADLLAASIRRGLVLDTDTLWEKVCAELPRFQARPVVKEK